MAKGFLFPGGVLSLPREAAERLLKAQSGDGALLYLCLLSGKDAASLQWDSGRLQGAYTLLVTLDLLDSADPPTAQPNTPPEPVTPPAYSSLDITQALTAPTPFSPLVEELQRLLGKILSPSDLQTLYVIYDYLALPAEVILLLTNWCMEETTRRYGNGRKPTLSQIKKEAFLWHRQGIDTLESAETYLSRLARRTEQGNHLLTLIGVHGREPVEAERRYLDAWSDMQFDDDALTLAYEKTVLKKSEMNWPYMNSILKNWHQQGLHNKTEITEKERLRWEKPRAPAGTIGSPVSAAAVEKRFQEDIDRFNAFYEENYGKGD
ncbi:MAG: DnaD domain protein [Evtepia sp.]